MTATKNYRVDSFIGGLAIKAPCVVETVANITLSGEQTVNGVAVVTDDRVLVKDQTDATENGIYDVSTSAWQRTGDWDGPRDATNGTLVVISRAAATTKLWQMTTASDPFYPGTSSCTFAAITDIDAINDLIADLASTATGEGASLIGIEDALAIMAATNVEDAIEELSLRTQLAQPASRGIIELATQAEVDAGTDTTRAVTPATLSNSGSFSVTFDTSTFTIADSHTWYYLKIGTHVMAFYTSTVSGTSNATTFRSVDGEVPAALRPETTQKTAIEIQDNGTREIGFISITATGQIQVSRVGAAAFTASGTKALSGSNFMIHWFLGDHTAF